MNRSEGRSRRRALCPPRACGGEHRPHHLCRCVDSFGTGARSDEQLATLISERIGLRPAAVIERLDLRRPIYAPTARFGHFGRPDLDLPWERPLEL